MKITIQTKLFKVIFAKWRLLFGFCPLCNSDAPEIDGCPVCNNYRGVFPPTKKTKKLWYYRFKLLYKLS